MQYKIVFLLLVLQLSLAKSFAQNKKAKEGSLSVAQWATIFDKYIQEGLATWQTPGLSVVVVKNGEIVLKKGYGVQNIIDNVPYTTSTLSTCASTTKAMTAVCMSILIDEGKIKWTDKVSDILTEFKLSNPYVTEEITVKDLFTHNTGLGNADLLWVLGYSREEILKRMSYVPMAYSLRSSFVYQNLMYITAGEVIRKVSGKSWEDFVTERLFTPLGMTNTYASYSKISATAAKTSSHHKDKNDNDKIKPFPYLYSDNIGATGGIWSCVDDMAKWIQFLQDSTKINGNRLLKAETFAHLFKPHALIPMESFYPTTRLTKPHWTSYGLGWFQHDYRGKMVQLHTGSLEGLVAILGMIPEEKLAIYVFGNLDHTEIRHALVYKAFDLWIFNDHSKDWSKDFLALYQGIEKQAKKAEETQVAKRILNTNPSHALASYAGKFHNKIYGEAEIELKNNALSLKLPNNISYYLQHWHYDTFEGKSTNWWEDKIYVPFSVDSSGSILGFSLFGIDYTREQ
jgi:CubicO group peptidase (beta-lactamase class C family)